jgi:2-dehydropantoate 2-reductase
MDQLCGRNASGHAGPMTTIIYGAGGIGGTIGGALHRAGHEVSLIARGPHLEALQSTGMRFRTPGGDETLTIPAVGSPTELSIGDDDRIILAMKTQDTVAALNDLAAAAKGEPAIICAQNGVENERLALRRFERVYGMCVLLPATHLEPGVIHAEGIPSFGVLDVGRFPSGSDDVAEQLVADLSGSGFISRVDADVMGRKYRKLIRNLGNAVDALCGRPARHGPLTDRVTQEGWAVLEAADISVTDTEEVDNRLYQQGEIDGVKRAGSSTWQSLARGMTSTEIDYLNGEIVLLGRMHGVPTPANSMLQNLLADLARTGAPPGSYDEADLLARLS